ncbi:MAG TPA: alpha/beta fold hydrolase [Thermoanaerobaculia bacterium]
MNSRTWKIFILSAAALAALAHCNTTDRTRRAYLRANAAALGAPPRPAIIIAGFGVTRLVDPVANVTVWGTPHAMWRTEYPDDLELDPHDRLVARGWVGSRGPVNIGWQLSIALRKFGGYTEGRDLHPFFYDWRRSARENAQLLGALIDEVRGGGKVDLVTHSAGALVALAYLKSTATPPVEHLVMIAPAQRGSLEAFRVFVRPERFLRRTFGREMIATWPSVFELLPDEGRVFVDERGQPLPGDLWDAKTWKLDVAPQLARARAFHDWLRETPMPSEVRVSVIAGDCVPTARKILARDDGSFVFYPDELRASERALAPLLFEPGDGTIPLSSARGGGEAMLFCDGHQGIAADPNVHRALIRTLRDF